MNRIILILLLAFVSSNAMADKERQLTPEQSRCLNNVAIKQMGLEQEFTKQQISALQKMNSTVDLTIQERRSHEETCIEEAKCFGNWEVALGAAFESCLKRVEYEETSVK